jgi:hypothetical protein
MIPSIRFENRFCYIFFSSESHDIICLHSMDWSPIRAMVPPFRDPTFPRGGDHDIIGPSQEREKKNKDKQHTHLNDDATSRSSTTSSTSTTTTSSSSLRGAAASSCDATLLLSLLRFDRRGGILLFYYFRRPPPVPLPSLSLSLSLSLSPTLLFRSLSRLPPPPASSVNSVGGCCGFELFGWMKCRSNPFCVLFDVFATGRAGSAASDFGRRTKMAGSWISDLPARYF